MEQWEVAIKRANEIRFARARMKREITAGKLTVAEVLADVPGYAETMTISELLRAQRQVSHRRARVFLMPLEISENRRVGDLTNRQLKAISAALEPADHRKRAAA